jgi:hypothetical protein
MTGDRNMKNLRPLLSESLRPQALSDLTLPTPTIERLQRVIESGSMYEYALFWATGRGKDQRSRNLYERHREQIGGDAHLLHLCCRRRNIF